MGGEISRGRSDVGGEMRGGSGGRGVQGRGRERGGEGGVGVGKRRGFGEVDEGVYGEGRLLEEGVGVW